MSAIVKQLKDHSNDVEEDLPNIAADVVQITPEIAKRYLLQNINNRPLRRQYVSELASAMRREEWVLNGETIKFAVNGNLLDGQHRLHAIIESRRTVPIIVVREVPNDAFSTIDMNRKRTVADALAIAGYPNEKLTGAAIRLVLLMSEETVNFRQTYSPTEIKEWADAYFDELAKWIPLGRTVSKANMAEASLVVALSYFFSQKDEQETRVFFARLADGLGMREGDPILALRARLSQNATSAAKLPRLDIAALIIKAWNLRRSDRRIEAGLAWRVDEGFPAVK